MSWNGFNGAYQQPHGQHAHYQYGNYAQQGMYQKQSSVWQYTREEHVENLREVCPHVEKVELAGEGEEAYAVLFKTGTKAMTLLVRLSERFPSEPPVMTLCFNAKLSKEKMIEHRPEGNVVAREAYKKFGGWGSALLGDVVVEVANSLGSGLKFERDSEVRKEKADGMEVVDTLDERDAAECLKPMSERFDQVYRKVGKAGGVLEKKRTAEKELERTKSRVEELGREAKRREDTKKSLEKSIRSIECEIEDYSSELKRDIKSNEEIKVRMDKDVKELEKALKKLEDDFKEHKYTDEEYVELYIKTQELIAIKKAKSEYLGKK